MKSSSIIAMVVGSVVAGTIASPGVAQAFLRRYHAMECAPQNSATSTIYNETLGLLNNSYSQATYVCPFISDDSQPHQNVYGFTVHGQKAYSNGTSDGVAACVKYYSVNGYACSVDTTTTAAGVWGLTLWYPTEWYFDTGANFPYIKVSLQPGSGIFGIFAAS